MLLSLLAYSLSSDTLLPIGWQVDKGNCNLYFRTEENIRSKIEKLCAVFGVFDHSRCSCASYDLVMQFTKEETPITKS